MTPTDKMEMQTAEEPDGSAIVTLPESVELPPQDNDDNGSERQSQSSNDNDNNGEEVDEEREQIRAARREERRLKKQIHREKTKESSHLITALRRQNEALAERLARVEQKTSGAELARVDKAIEDASVEVEYAKMKMQDAVSKQDGHGVTEAQERWFEAKRKQESLQNIKKQATSQMSQSKQNINAPDPMVQRLAAEWMERNEWYDPNGKNEESAIAQVVDKKLTDEGFDPSSEDYWDELDDRLKKYIPNAQKHVYNETKMRNQRPRSVVTSSGRESMANSRGNDYVLSTERVNAMKEAGVWDNLELRKKATQRYIEWDRNNKSRG
jgi:hypothetical protein